MKSLQPRNSAVLCMTDEAIDSLAKRYTSVLLQVERATKDSIWSPKFNLINFLNSSWLDSFIIKSSLSESFVVL